MAATAHHSRITWISGLEASQSSLAAGQLRAATGSYGQIVSRCRQRPSSLPSSVVAGDRDGAGRTVDNDGVALVDDASGISNHDNCW